MTDTLEVQSGIEQLIVEVSQIVENNCGNQIAQELQENIEQPIEQHAPQKDAT